MTKQQLEDLLGQLTLDEKIGMIHGNELFATKGVERLGIPPFRTSDGPRGVRKDFPADNWNDIGLTYDSVSYMPCNSAIAATWNRELAHQSGQLLGKEARGRGKDMILAPGINIMRSPLCGRSFEYMGEDPYLTSEIVVPLIQGIEENDVAACVKHYALNNQETRRLDVDVEVSERALREIYLPGFEAAVKRAKTKGIMGAYNKLHGQHCCHNSYLLQDILRKEWGYEGMVVSDWGGTHSTKEAAENGLDMEMSVTNNFDDYFMANPLKKAVENGEISIDLIDEKVRHILHVMNELHMLDGERKRGTYNDYRDKAALRRTAEESVVLLKNNRNLLPLDAKKVKKLLVIGENANREHAPGGGSAEIKALYEITPLMGLHMLLGGNTQITYLPGYCNEDVGNIWAQTDDGANGQADSLDSSKSTVKARRKKKEWQKKNARYQEEALAAARDADAVIYIGGLTHDYDTEGKDRENMKLPYEQDVLISRLLEVRPDAIITMVAGSPIDMTAWLDRADTLVYSWYAGMEGGYALAEALFGNVNPSGHLPETFPLHLEDCPATVLGEFPGNDTVRYTEDIYVGYRYYDTYNIPVAFPFGYGLSYTTFAFTALQARKCADTVEVTFTVTNTGTRAGYALAQLYVSDTTPQIKKPTKELKGFEKVYLAPNESRNVTIQLDRRAFAYYNESQHDFVVDAGTYHITLATSALDAVEAVPIEIN